MTSFYEGISLWAKFVLPALFPILFFASLLNSSNVTRNIGNFLSPVTKKLFNCSGVSGYIYILSILSGYPVGAKATSEIYEKGIITQKEACRITAFASTSGPLFILGTVGVGMFGSMRLGVVVLISHLLGALINGIIFRNLYKKKNISNFTLPKTTKSANILEDCMLSSIKSILLIGGYIALSYMLITIVNSYNLLLPITTSLNQIFGLDINTSNAILNGLFEITKGIKELSILGLNENICAIISTGIISMGGISIFLQAYTYLAKFQIKIRLYLLEKILHTAISCAICSILVIIF